MGVVACYEVQYGPWRGWCLESQAQHVRGMLWESCGTFGRSRAVMWCFGMRHFAP